MLDKNTRWFFPGQDVQGVMNSIGGAVYQLGIHLAPSGPMRWQGEGPKGSYGLGPKLWVTVIPDQGGFWLDIRLWADLDVGYLVLFIVLWGFCFPGAILLMVLGSQSWTQRADELMLAMQQPVAHLQSTPQWGQMPRM